MKKFIDNLFASLDNRASGFSGKKLTALALVVCVVAAHVKWLSYGNFDQLVTVLMTDYGFIAVLFGINTYDKKVNGSTTTSLEQSADGNKTVLKDDHNPQ